jgi:hypothetical protein
MADLVGREEIFDKPFADYCSAYPDENKDGLLADIYIAAHEVRIASEQVLNVVGIFEEGERLPLHLLILEGMRKTLNEFTRRRKPAWKRIFGGTMFNYEPEPIRDRIETSKENINKCAMFLLARGWAGK